MVLVAVLLVVVVDVVVDEVVLDVVWGTGWTPLVVEVVSTIILIPEQGKSINQQQVLHSLLQEHKPAIQGFLVRHDGNDYHRNPKSNFWFILLFGLILTTKLTT